jgi:hypothetical protein
VVAIFNNTHLEQDSLSQHLQHFALTTMYCAIKGDHGIQQQQEQQEKQQSTTTM